MKDRILVGIGPKNHIRLALDEIEGLEDQGYICKSVIYGRNADNIGIVNRLYGVVANAIKIVLTLYHFSPNIVYLNSRFEPAGSTRDCISIFIFKLFYWKKLWIVIKSHGSELSILSSNSFFYKKVVLSYLFKKVDGWFFLSKEEKTTIESYYPKLNGKVIVTSNIIDPKRSKSSVEFKQRYALDENKFKIIFVGRIVRVKGVFNILTSISSLNFKDKCTFIFVGDGSDLTELRALAESLNIAKYIRFLGFIPDQECDHFYANTDVLLYPTFDTEGFPMALFKSVAAGLPIITTQIRAAKDHLKSPENVLWVNGKSSESIGAAITELYHNKSLRNTMASNNKILGNSFTRNNICSEMSKSLFKKSTLRQSNN